MRLSRPRDGGQAGNMLTRPDAGQSILSRPSLCRAASDSGTRRREVPRTSCLPREQPKHRPAAGFAAPKHAKHRARRRRKQANFQSRSKPPHRSTARRSSPASITRWPEARPPLPAYRRTVDTGVSHVRVQYTGARPAYETDSRGRVCESLRGAKRA